MATPDFFVELKQRLAEANSPGKYNTVQSWNHWRYLMRRFMTEIVPFLSLWRFWSEKKVLVHQACCKPDLIPVYSVNNWWLITLFWCIDNAARNAAEEDIRRMRAEDVVSTSQKIGLPSERTLWIEEKRSQNACNSVHWNKRVSLLPSEWLGFHLTNFVLIFRSEERRVGKECRSRWSPYH